MLQSLINKDNIVKKEILEVILKTNNSIFMKKIDFILKNCLKIRKIETFLSSVILLNKNNYFGNYSLIFNKELLDSIISKDKNKFIEIFSNPDLKQESITNLLAAIWSGCLSFGAVQSTILGLSCRM